jgi:hypothetical protein
VRCGVKACGLNGESSIEPAATSSLFRVNPRGAAHDLKFATVATTRAASPFVNRLGREQHRHPGEQSIAARPSETHQTAGSPGAASTPQE